jgi:tripartite-type tricarboxylate transporter receptor subunit TctC
MKTSLHRAATSQHQAATPQRSRPSVNDQPYPKTRPSGQHPRRRFLHLAAGAAALPAATRIARAQVYPTRPITLIVPLSAGGPTDVVGRVVAERMRGSLGQPIIIENITGADGTIGTGRAARATPDGYTLVLGGQSTHVLNGAFYSLPYDVLNDFAPIAPLATFPFILFARKMMPAKNLNELIASLKANPNKIAVGSATGNTRLMMSIFQKQTGTQVTLVPYRGAAQAMQDLLADQIDLLFYPPDALPLAQTGSIKAYAVTSDNRLAAAPDIPTFGEMGLPAVLWVAWYGLFAPRGTPKNIVSKLNDAVVEALAVPIVRARLADFGLEIVPRDRQTPEALTVLQKTDAEKWWPIIKEAGIKAQ